MSGDLLHSLWNDEAFARPHRQAIEIVHSVSLAMAIGAGRWAGASETFWFEADGKRFLFVQHVSCWALA